MLLILRSAPCGNASQSRVGVERSFERQRRSARAALGNLVRDGVGKEARLAAVTVYARKMPTPDRTLKRRIRPHVVPTSDVPTMRPSAFSSRQRFERHVISNEVAMES